jgi:outer membrane protein TolC
LALLFERRKSLGISEEAEQIQVRSAVSQSRVQLEEMLRILQKQWVLLAVSLKLDEEDRLTDPTKIPVDIGILDSEKNPICSGSVDKNRDIRQLELELDAIRIQTRVAIDQMRPDLTLDLGLGTNGSVLNGVDDFGLRWLNTLQARYPAYSLGLLFRMPLDGSREKSQILNAASGSAQLESKLSEIRSRLASDLETQCAELGMLGRHTTLYTDLEKEQKRRIVLEETRYRQARSSPFTVLQAGEELYGTTLSLNRIRAEATNKQWALKKVKGVLYDELDSWSLEKTGKTLFQIARERSMK